MVSGSVGGCDQISKLTGISQTFALARTDQGKILLLSAQKTLFGISTPTDTWVTVPIPDEKRIVNIVGAHHSECALLFSEDGVVYSLGSIDDGGDKDKKDQKVPDAPTYLAQCTCRSVLSCSGSKQNNNISMASFQPLVV